MSLDNFANVLVNDIKSAVENEVKTVAKEALRKAILTTVYLRQKTYRPTYNLLDAVEVSDVKIGASRATFTVMVNASKLKPDTATNPWNWNAHASIKNVPFQEGLVETLDQGISSPVYTHPAYGFFDKAEDDMEKNMIVAMANALRAKGWDAKII